MRNASGGEWILCFICASSMVEAVNNRKFLITLRYFCGSTCRRTGRRRSREHDTEFLEDLV